MGAAFSWLTIPFAELEKRNFTFCQTELCAKCMSHGHVSRALRTGLIGWWPLRGAPTTAKFCFSDFDVKRFPILFINLRSFSHDLLHWWFYTIYECLKRIVSNSEVIHFEAYGFDRRETIQNENVNRSTWTDRQIIKKPVSVPSTNPGIDRIQSIESVSIARLYFSMDPCQSNPYPPFISCYATQQYVPPAPAPSCMLSWSRVQYQTIIIDKF